MMTSRKEKFTIENISSHFNLNYIFYSIMFMSAQCSLYFQYSFVHFKVNIFILDHLGSILIPEHRRKVQVNCSTIYKIKLHMTTSAARTLNMLSL